jgi:hypothetical protein
VGDLRGLAGTAWLDTLPLPARYAFMGKRPLELIDVLDRQLDDYERISDDWLHDDVGFHAIQALDAVGPTIGAILSGPRSANVDR